MALLQGLASHTALFHIYIYFAAGDQTTNTGAQCGYYMFDNNIDCPANAESYGDCNYDTDSCSTDEIVTLKCYCKCLSYNFQSIHPHNTNELSVNIMFIKGHCMSIQ